MLTEKTRPVARGVANPGLTPIMLNHAAYVTHDVAATADFYTRIMGMELASTVFDDSIPSTGDQIPYFHIFFRMQDGSTLACGDTDEHSADKIRAQSKRPASSAPLICCRIDIPPKRSNVFRLGGECSGAERVC